MRAVLGGAIACLSVLMRRERMSWLSIGKLSFVGGGSVCMPVGLAIGSRSVGDVVDAVSRM